MKVTAKVRNILSVFCQAVARQLFPQGIKKDTQKSIILNHKDSWRESD